MKEIPKAYEPKNYEDNIYKKWEESGLFNPDVCIEKGITSVKDPHFSIVLPPPNVTGTLHMGHAAMLAIQDVMVRYHRMKGDWTLWVPGTDHAAIATQAKVEKILIAKGIKNPRQEMGREKFLEEVKKFAQESHDTIVNQCKKMGASLDWSREAYTLDEQRNLAVRTVFKKMYDDGLIYRGYRIVNWCPHCLSTLADDEVVHKEQTTKLYTFKYDKDFPIAISTTRPETKLGDTAVAVNPKDKRYAKYIGKVFNIKSFAGGADLKIQVISSPEVEMDFGTGALGVTPAHSLVDYEMAQKNKLPIIKIIDEDGKMMAEAGKNYEGLAVNETRRKVVEYLQQNGLMENEEDVQNNLSVCYRCETPIEPLPSQQWFIDVNKPIKTRGKKSLKQLMQKAVGSKKDQIRIIPDHFEKTYFHWIDNLRDWCISRQIWFGHQIPVWYKRQLGGPHQAKHFNNDVFLRKLAMTDADFRQNTSEWQKLPDYAIAGNGPNIQVGPTLLQELKDRDLLNEEWIEQNQISQPVYLKEEIYCGIEAPKENGWQQDPDTLDTWFSSGLWTFSTLGYPDLKAEDLKNYHPTSVMETGYDILFFWVARMILMTTYVLGDIPFKTIYLHGLVRDEKGAKMSKSLGNVIDPLDMIAKYGTDATRLSLLLGNTPGNDMKLSEEKIAGFRNFTNKLWNISRFMLLNIENPQIDIEKPKAKTLADEWILNRLNQVNMFVVSFVDMFQFSVAGDELRDFVWGDLADWYLEIAKVEGGKSEILNYILNTILKLWHPYMPFVTETIWQEVYGEDKVLMIEKWPMLFGTQHDPDFIDGKYIRVDSYYADIEVEFDVIKTIITNIRSLRTEYKIEPAKKINAKINAGKKEKLLKENEEVIKALARLEKLEFVKSGAEVSLDLAGAVDVSKEKPRLEKEIAEIKKYVGGLEGKLSNKEFVNNAPKAVVEKEQEKLSEAKLKLEKLTEQFENLK